MLPNSQASESVTKISITSTRSSERAPAMTAPTATRMTVVTATLIARSSGLVGVVLLGPLAHLVGLVVDQRQGRQQEGGGGDVEARHDPLQRSHSHTNSPIPTTSRTRKIMNRGGAILLPI